MGEDTEMTALVLVEEPAKDTRRIEIGPAKT